MVTTTTMMTTMMMMMIMMMMMMMMTMMVMMMAMMMIMLIWQGGCSGEKGFCWLYLGQAATTQPSQVKDIQNALD